MVDGGDVSPADVEEWSEEFKRVLSRVGPLFAQSTSRVHAEQYLRGLLAPIERKNGWTISEFVGAKEPKALQRFLNLARWDAGALRDVVCDYAVEHLNAPRGVLVADLTGFAKKGTKSAGVQRQYSGTLGRIDNCQIGTFLAYVNTNRERVLIDRELYIPEKSWFGNPERCAEAAIPEGLPFRTMPQQVIGMIERARWSELTFSWFTADEEFGQNLGLRQYLEQAEIAYVMAIPKNTEFTDHTGNSVVIQYHADRLPPNDWQRRACGIGAKGFRVYDWALLESDDPDHQYMIRRSIDDGELDFYHCYNPRREGFGELVRVAGARWPIEECSKPAKVESVSTITRYASITPGTGTSPWPCSRTPFSPSAPTNTKPKRGPPRQPRHPEIPKINNSGPGDTTNPAPARPTRTRIRRLLPLTVAETRRLFNAAHQVKHAIEHALHWSYFRRHHQADARRHHFRRRLKTQALAL